MTIHEREAARKWTVPVLKTWGQGFTCIYTHIKIKGERRKSRRECWMEEEEGTQGSNHTIPLPPMPRSKDKVFGTGKVGSGLTNSLLPSGVLHFGQLAFFLSAGPVLPFVLIKAQIPLFTPLPEVRAVTGLVSWWSLSFMYVPLLNCKALS